MYYLIDFNSQTIEKFETKTKLKRVLKDHIGYHAGCKIITQKDWEEDEDIFYFSPVTILIIKGELVNPKLSINIPI